VVQKLPVGEAFASWQWCNYLIGKVPAGKKALLINMDETAVCLYPGTRRGTVILSKTRQPGSPVQPVSRASRRTYLTHVAFICDTPSYQKYLPQVVVGNEHTFLVRDFARLKGRCPSHFKLVRQKGAWNNASLMCEILERLRVALAPFAAKVQPILLMDVASMHWAPVVMNRCRNKGIWPMPVPAKLTWLLQPCDTHMFARYKLHVQKAYQNRQAEAAAAGALDVERLLDCIYEADEHVVGDIVGWKQAFQEDGFGAKQVRLSDSRKRHLQLEAAPEVGDSQPSLDQVKLCFPKRMRPPLVSQLFCCSALRAPVLPAAKVAALPLPSGVPRGVRMFGRAARPASSSGLPAVGGGRGSGSVGSASAARREPRTRAEHKAAALASTAAPGA